MPQPFEKYSHQYDTTCCRKCVKDNNKIQYIQVQLRLSHGEARKCRALGCPCNGKYNGKPGQIVGCHVDVFHNGEWVTGLVPGCKIANRVSLHRKLGCQQWFDSRYVVLLLNCRCGKSFEDKFQHERTDCVSDY